MDHISHLLNLTILGIGISEKASQQSQLKSINNLKVHLFIEKTEYFLQLTKLTRLKQ